MISKFAFERCNVCRYTSAQLQTQEKFNGMDDTATLKGPPDAFYFTPQVVGGDGDPMDILLRQPAKVGLVQVDT
jgi:inorganic pyrophosphatase